VNSAQIVFTGFRVHISGCRVEDVRLTLEADVVEPFDTLIMQNVDPLSLENNLGDYSLALLDALQ
jgi:hypothetical protein